MPASSPASPAASAPPVAALATAPPVAPAALSPLRRLYRYLLPHKKSLAAALACMVASGLLSGAFFFLFEEVLTQILHVAQPSEVQKELAKAANAGASDAALGEQFRRSLNVNIDRTQMMRQLNVFMLVVVAWACARVFVDYSMRYLIERTGQRVLKNLRHDLFAHFQKLSISFFESRRTGEVMSRLTNDLTALQTVLTVAVISAVRAPVEVLGALGFMFWTNWQLSLFVFVILPPVAWIISRAGVRIRRATAQLQEQLAELSNYLQEKIAAMRLIQTFGTRRHEVEQFSLVNEGAYERTMTPVRIQASLGPAIEFVGYMGVLLVLWFGARGGMEAQSLIVFLFAMHKAAMNFKAVAALSNMLRGGEAAAERLFEMLDTQPEVRDAPDAVDLRERGVQGHLRFENVSFSYNAEREVLRDISFEIKPGEVVAIAGQTGSGKSTIASLVPRLYDPTAGRVTLDGVDLRAVSLDSLRLHIGAVPQETTLFHGTIRDNIAYGKPDATFEQVLEAARRAHADEFIRAKPQGYDTHVGERGTKLSGGQQQRIAIARALLRDPKLLILDEATSSLDAEIESLVQEALEELMRDRTTLIIAHRFSTIQNADRILVLEKGRIVESGHHAQLMEKRGWYYRLYQMQSFLPSVAAEETTVATADASTCSPPGTLGIAAGA
jgi:subfamily B ATP-binding cassette protein MsbA